MSPLRLWDECERLHVSRPQDAEVTVIERGHLRFIEALDNGEHGGIHEPDIGASITIAQLANPPIVLCQHPFHQVRAGNNVVQECDEHPRMEPGMNPLIHFHEHGRRNDQRFIRRFEELTAGAHQPSGARCQRGLMPQCPRFVAGAAGG